MTSFLALGFGTQELIIVVVLVLILFGGKKIPELMRGVGKGVGELKKGLDEGKRDLDRAVNDDASNNADQDEIRSSKS